MGRRDDKKMGIVAKPRGHADPMNAIPSDSPSYPVGLLLLVVAMLGVGLVMVTSATAPLDHSLLDTAPWRSYYGRQAIFAVLGVIALISVAKFFPFALAQPKIRRILPDLALALAVVLLILVLIPGIAEARRGSQRWLHLGPSWLGLGFQPSELTKFAMVLAMASRLGDRCVDIGRFWRGFVPPAIIMGICVAMVGKEDFGTALILAVTGAILLIGSGCRWSHLGIAGSLGVVGMAALLIAEPYRIDRLTAARDPWDNIRGNDYQPIQSLTTIASGHWWGTGLGAGVQKHGYIPEGHTDFIFAVICEEMGAFGGMMVMGLYVAFLWIGLRIMLDAPTRFERLIALGITTYITAQALLNIAVVTVVTPTTGISLPLISAGGSGVIMICVSIGVLAAIGKRSLMAVESDGANVDAATRSALLA